MSRHTASIGPAYFDQLYAADPDPWRFASSDYERDKYAASLAALPPGRFASALEVGCSIGIFTRALAPRCDALLSVDVAEAALEQARIACQAPHVRFRNLRIPGSWPEGSFDLIVLSEVLYYLTLDDLDLTARAVRATIASRGTVLLVHYLGETDYPLSGDAAADGFIRSSALSVQLSQRTALYRIDALGEDA